MPLTKPSIENDALMARYPFLPQGNNFLKIVLEKNGVTVNDLIEEPWLEEVRARGRIRLLESCLLYTSPSPRDKRQSRMPSSA